MVRYIIVSSAKSLMLLLIVWRVIDVHEKEAGSPRPSPEGHQKGLGKSQNAPHPGLRSGIYLIGMI